MNSADKTQPKWMQAVILGAFSLSSAGGGNYFGNMQGAKAATQVMQSELSFIKQQRDTDRQKLNSLEDEVIELKSSRAVQSQILKRIDENTDKLTEQMKSVEISIAQLTMSFKDKKS